MRYSASWAHDENFCKHASAAHSQQYAPLQTGLRPVHAGCLKALSQAAVLVAPPLSRHSCCWLHLTSQRICANRLFPAVFAHLADYVLPCRLSHSLCMQETLKALCQLSRHLMAAPAPAVLAESAGRVLPFRLNCCCACKTPSRHSATYGGTVLAAPPPAALAPSKQLKSADELVPCRLVIALDYRDPYMNLFQEFQRWKSHPKIQGVLEGGTCLQYGARSVLATA